MIKKIYILIAIVISLQTNAQRAQELTNGQIGDIQLIERKMQRIGKQFLQDSSETQRLEGAHKFIKLLVQALKVENSFNYNFDSLPNLSKIYSEDRDIKIFTFSVVLKNYEFRYYGCIQFNTPELNIIPFMDYSDTFPTIPQYQLSNKNWYGMIYYNMKTMQIGKKKVYLLFGYDLNDVLSDKKIVEPMWIENGNKTARFGMPIFNIEDKIYNNDNIYRYVLEYRTGANAKLNYDEELDLIIHDHLIPLDEKSFEVGYLKVPDGTNSALKWNPKSEMWDYIEYLKLSKSETNDPIRPMPSKSLELKGEE